MSITFSLFEKIVTSCFHPERPKYELAMIY